MKNQAKVGANLKKKQEKVNWILFFNRLFSYLFFIWLADAEKLEYDSDNGGRNKSKGGGSSTKKRSPAVTSKKRPAHSPPATNGKRKKR